jgi:hypothetical protein
MSLHEELNKLDLNRIGRAAGTVVGKVEWTPNGPDDALPSLQHYLVLRALSRTCSFQGLMELTDPAGLDEARARDMTKGAVLVLGILAEYAQLEELENAFPDMPRPE